MYVGALDYGGNIPVSVNNMLNGGLPRALLHIETALKAQGPPSRSRWPTMSVATPEPSAQGPWALDGIEPYKVPIDQVIDGDDYVITVTVQPPTGRDDKLRPVLSHSDSKSSMASSRSHLVDYSEDIRRGRRDLIVAEIDVAAELVKNGCEIAIRAVSLPEAYHGPGGSDASVLPLDYPGDKLGMPFKCSVISLAPSVLQTASLDPTSQTRHMLRVTLPTSGYEAPVNDPLTGKTAPLPRPRWLLDLINDGAVVQVRLLPRRSDPPAYMFEGVELSVEDERKNPRQKEPVKLKLPQVVNAPGAVSLDKPLAVARQYLPDTPATPAPQPEEDSDTNSLDTKTPTNQPAELPAEKKVSFLGYSVELTAGGARSRAQAQGASLAPGAQIHVLAAADEVLRVRAGVEARLARAPARTAAERESVPGAEERARSRAHRGVEHRERCGAPHHPRAPPCGDHRVLSLPPVRQPSALPPQRGRLCHLPAHRDGAARG
jgi:hypothetical protein